MSQWNNRLNQQIAELSPNYRFIASYRTKVPWKLPTRMAEEPTSLAVILARPRLTLNMRQFSEPTAKHAVCVLEVRHGRRCQQRCAEHGTGWMRGELVFSIAPNRSTFDNPRTPAGGTCHSARGRKAARGQCGRQRELFGRSAGVVNSAPEASPSIEVSPQTRRVTPLYPRL
jgi:hypothetical protein